MTVRLRVIALAAVCVALTSTATDAQTRKPRRSPPVAAPAQESVEPGPLFKKLRSMGGWGRDCPPQKRALTDWKAALQFVPKMVEGKPILVISGQFFAGDSDRLAEYLASSGPIKEIWLDSGGGNAAEGPRMGEVIRRARLKTRVAEGFACISSCSMAFLGGVIRQIDDGAIYGLHTFYDDSALADITGRSSELSKRNVFHGNEQGNAILAGEIQLYGQKMGISRDFFTKVMFAQRSEIFVSDSYLQKMRLEMAKAMTSEEANAFISRLSERGIIFRTSNDNVGDSDLNRFFRFLRTEHSSEEADVQIGNLLQTFRCISASELAYYNIVNTVRR